MTSASDVMTFENAATMGLSRDEWDLINQRLGRTPNLCELGIFSAMWSEHCSYKSSKKWLKTLPIDGPQVIEGPAKMPVRLILVMGLLPFSKSKAITTLLLSSHIRVRQPALAVFCAMSSPWARGLWRC